MASLNEIARERKLFWKDLKKHLRNVDSWQEKMERKINQVLARKRDMPDEEDLADLVGMMQAMADSWMAFGGIIDMGYPF